MYRRASMKFEGWKIVLRCNEFRCQDGGRQYASTAILRQSTPRPEGASLYGPGKGRHTIIFPIDAFDTPEEANDDAAAQAMREILAMNSSGGCSPADESLAARYEVSFDGKRYAFREHRYDLFPDALRYAMAQHAKQGFRQDAAFQPSWAAAYRPTAADAEAMALHGIVYANGHYDYGGFHYGQLGDAVAFAKGHPNL